MNVYQLIELNNFIRRVVALNFAQPLWIEAEIAQASRSRGHLYLDLVQKGDNNEPMAQAQGVLWENDYRKLRINHGLVLDQVLREGVALKMQVRVEFHERYGLKLHLVDIDPAYTLGQLALQRRQTLATLEKEGLLALNRQKPLSPVLQRIAVVSSEGAAGLQDFREHLSQNAFGYQFHVQFFQSSVQGRNAVMPTIVRKSSRPYRWEVGAVELARVANVEKKLPRNFITPDGFGITARCRTYLEPLIAGEDPPPYRDGLPAYVRIKGAAVRRKLPSFKV